MSETLPMYCRFVYIVKDRCLISPLMMSMKIGSLTKTKMMNTMTASWKNSAVQVPVVVADERTMTMMRIIVLEMKTTNMVVTATMKMAVTTNVSKVWMIILTNYKYRCLLRQAPANASALPF